MNLELMNSVPLMIGLGIVVVIQLGLLAWAMVDWVKRPAEFVRGNRVVWLIVIALFNLIGPILYLTVGRLPVVIGAPPTPGSEQAMRAAADVLYGHEEADA